MHGYNVTKKKKCQKKSRHKIQLAVHLAGDGAAQRAPRRTRRLLFRSNRSSWFGNNMLFARKLSHGSRAAENTPCDGQAVGLLENGVVQHDHVVPPSTFFFFLHHLVAPLPEGACRLELSSHDVLAQSPFRLDLQRRFKFFALLLLPFHQLLEDAVHVELIFGCFVLLQQLAPLQLESLAQEGVPEVAVTIGEIDRSCSRSLKRR